MALPVSNTWSEMGASKLKLIKSRLQSRLKNDLLNSFLQMSTNGPDAFSKESDDIIRRAIKLWMKVKKVCYKTTGGQNDVAEAPQAGQTEQAKSITVTEAGTQTEKKSVELVERQEVAANVSCLDLGHEGNEESDSKEGSGWEDDDNEDYIYD